MAKGLFLTEVAECLAVALEHSGTGDEAEVFVVFVYDWEVPCVGLLKLLGHEVECIIDADKGWRSLHEHAYRVFVVQFWTEHIVANGVKRDCCASSTWSR